MTDSNSKAPPPAVSSRAPGAKPSRPPAGTTPAILPRADLAQLLSALQANGRRLVGPTLQDGAIVYDDIESEHELPIGWTDEQQPGRYRLKKRDDEAVFGYVVGPQSFKREFHVPEQRLFRAKREGGTVRFTPEPQESPPLALLGARSCDLQGLEIQDHVFLNGPHSDSYYRARRADVFVVAVHCITSSSSCFCTSMGTGPAVSRGYDLALTELLDGDHRFLVDIGSAGGAALVEELGLEPATAADVDHARGLVHHTARTMDRWLDTRNIRTTLLENLEHPRWDEVAERCLACTNCTMVCPTCFCTTTEDTTTPGGDETQRTRRWDSCFTEDFSYIHGGVVRGSVKSRYRQWLTHKLANWIEQFGRSGCVGCGRCITWCPVGIDITEEVAAIAGTSDASPQSVSSGRRSR